DASDINATAADRVENESKISCFGESAEIWALSCSNQNSIFLDTTVVAIAGLRFPMMDCQALFNSWSILLSMGSLNTPMSSNARSVDLETWENAASSLGFLFQTAAGSSSKGKRLFKALGKKGSLSGSVHSFLIASEITECTEKLRFLCSLSPAYILSCRDNSLLSSSRPSVV
ncbi:hypothetical protein AB205_0199590, partial [Aquarana catesbeiana]